MASTQNYEITEGVRKAAILLMSLDEDDAAALMSKLPRPYVEQVSLAIAQLDTISGTEQEGIIGEFLASRPSALGPNTGGLDRAKSLVKSIRKPLRWCSVTFQLPCPQRCSVVCPSRGNWR
jgi:flagellar motor switch protein FliG